MTDIGDGKSTDADKTHRRGRGHRVRRYLALLSGQDLIQVNGEGKFQMTAAGQKTLGQISSVIRAFSA